MPAALRGATRRYAALCGAMRRYAALSKSSTCQRIINFAKKGEHLEETKESTDTREQDESLSVGKNEFQAMEVTFYISIYTTLRQCRRWSDTQRNTIRVTIFNKGETLYYYLSNLFIDITKDKSVGIIDGRI